MKNNWDQMGKGWSVELNASSKKKRDYNKVRSKSNTYAPAAVAPPCVAALDPFSLPFTPLLLPPVLVLVVLVLVLMLVAVEVAALRAAVSERKEDFRCAGEWAPGTGEVLPPVKKKKPYRNNCEKQCVKYDQMRQSTQF